MSTTIESSWENERLKEQLASRDAEVAELEKEVADHHFSWAGCSQQLKDVCKDLEEVEQERDQLREQVTLLRDAGTQLLGRKRPNQTDDDPRLILEIDCLNLEEALAATEPKP